MDCDCKISIKETVYSTPLLCPFGMTRISLRQFARKTGLDVGYLSRVKSGKTPVTKQRYDQLIKVAEEQS